MFADSIISADGNVGQFVPHHTAGTTCQKTAIYDANIVRNIVVLRWFLINFNVENDLPADAMVTRRKVRQWDPNVNYMTIDQFVLREIF